jgi:hypothetical protein
MPSRKAAASTVSPSLTVKVRPLDWIVTVWGMRAWTA